MDAPTHNDVPRPFLANAGTDISPFGLCRHEPLLTIGFSCVPWGFLRTGDGRGGNARDRRKARRAGRLWRSLPDVVRDAYDGPDASERATALMTDALNAAIWKGGR